MGRPSIADDIAEKIKLIWAEDPTQFASSVFRRAKVDLKGCPSQRKVLDIVKAARKEADTEALTAIDPELIPWGYGWPGDPEDIACLLKLRTTALLLSIPPIDVRTAEWSLKLRKVFHGEWEGTTIHLLLSKQYAGRQKAAETLHGKGAEPDYQDLDAAVMFHFWTSEEDTELYLEAIEREGIPLPPILIKRLPYGNGEEVLQASPHEATKYYHCSGPDDRLKYPLEDVTRRIFTGPFLIPGAAPQIW